MKVLGVDLFEKDIPTMVEMVIEECQNGQRLNRLVSARDAHGLVIALEDDTFRFIQNNFWVNLPDGMPIVWVGRWKGAKEMQRCYGPDFFAAVMRATAALTIRHFLCGGTEGVAERLKEVCAEKFGNSHVVGVYSPPFREMSEAELQDLAEQINRLAVDIVWIGISTPKQERFAYRLSRYTDVHYLCTVGAAFDFHTGRVRQAPKWVQRSGLEWFFRLITEPRRLWRRYAKIVPLFIFYNLRELARGDFFPSEPSDLRSPADPNQRI